MHRALVAVDGTERDRELLSEAADYAAGTDAELLLLVTVPEETIEANSETIDRIAEVEHTSYSSDTVLASVENPVRETAEAVIGNGVDYEIRTGVTDERVDAILQVAEEAGCDHLFMLGRRRSPTGKAVFGDETQRAILNFEGYVTVSFD
ncbi:universal stress protein [Halalkalicoccus tibetensis]|uniref:Universal stress protein n=1 Tax=Halalkalicoccus tibetensis TaxID=175632 RepID=A0ABD5V4T0_9EURY